MLLFILVQILSLTAYLRLLLNSIVSTAISVYIDYFRQYFRVRRAKLIVLHFCRCSPFKITKLHLSPDKFPQQSPRLILWPSADHKLISIPNKRRNNFDFLHISSIPRLFKYS